MAGDSRAGRVACVVGKIGPDIGKKILSRLLKGHVLNHLRLIKYVGRDTGPLKREGSNNTTSGRNRRKEQFHTLGQ